MIDPAWEGTVQFYELVFGTWLSYIFLVVMWEKVLRQPLEEWRYVMLNFVGAGAFWVNHYFQYAEFWSTMLNAYSVGFLAVWYLVSVRNHGRGWGWQLGAMFGAIVYTVAFILFENVSRYGVDKQGLSEFWFMLISYFGFVGVIYWRGQQTRATNS